MRRGPWRRGQRSSGARDELRLSCKELKRELHCTLAQAQGAAEAQGVAKSCEELRRRKGREEAEGAAGVQGAAEASCGGQLRRRKGGAEEARRGELRRSKVVAGVPRGARSGAADAQGASRGG